MTTLPTERDRPEIQAAVSELKRRILRRFPTATFALSRGMGEDPDGFYLLVTVDIDDPDDVLDLVMDRLIDLQDAHALQLWVLPMRTRERVAEELAARESKLGAAVSGSR
jgi:hypothetical protein